MKDSTHGVISRVIISIPKTLHDQQTITITAKNQQVVLEKVAKTNNVNVYESSDHFLNSSYIQWGTNFGAHIFIIEDDLGYNHVNDMCPNYCQREPDEQMFSVFFCDGKAAVTVFVVATGG